MTSTDELGCGPRNQQVALGVALSGGGVRASLFALGALMSLVDSGQNARVSEIASVSGGSITNAAMAQRFDFSRVTSKDFDKYAHDLVDAVVRGLVPKWSVVTAYGLLAAFVIAITALSWPISLPLWADLVLAFVLGLLVLLRGVVLVTLLRLGILRHPNRTLGSLHVESTVNHVFCATDLNSSAPAYFLSQPPYFVSLAWGRSTNQSFGKEFAVASAVRASAAFPGGLPPLRVDAGNYAIHPTFRQVVGWHADREFSDMKFEAPATMYLADGGVWNNLGTDWFLSSRPADLGLGSGDRYVAARQFIVVDASAPAVPKMSLWYLRYPWIAEIGSIVRTLKALSNSTVLSRIDGSWDLSVG